MYVQIQLKVKIEIYFRMFNFIVLASLVSAWMLYNGKLL